MYLKEYFPFYTTYANPLLYEGERMQDKEFNLMKSYYPGTVQHIQEKIEEECDLMDYEGSRLYDEYPDKYMIYHLSCKIRESMEPEISTQAIRVKLSLVLTLILIQSVSVISRTGNLIHTKVSNLMKKSADVEHLTRWAVLFLQYTVLRS